MEKVFLGKDGKPMVAARHVQFNTTKGGDSLDVSVNTFTNKGVSNPLEDVEDTMHVDQNKLQPEKDVAVQNVVTSSFVDDCLTAVNKGVMVFSVGRCHGGVPVKMTGVTGDKHLCFGTVSSGQKKKVDNECLDCCFVIRGDRRRCVKNGRKGSVKAGGFGFGSLAVERKRYKRVALFSWSVKRPLGTSLIEKRYGCQGRGRGSRRSRDGSERVQRGAMVDVTGVVKNQKRSDILILHGDKVTKVPIWVKMHKVPTVAYSKDGLSLIATQIKKPIMLDEFTSAMCADSWGRLGFSQALIEEELIKECDMGESSRQNGSAGIHADPEPNSLDSDIEVEENIQGLNCAPKQTKVQQVVNENHLSVCAILESHVDIAALSKVCSKVFRCWDWTLNASLCAKGCRIILRRHLWSDLGHRKHVVHGVPWVLMGDFNVVLNMEDCYSGSSCFNFAMLDFKDYVSNIKVMDINFLGLHFTWNQKPKGGGGLLKKLDRIMGNVEFFDSFLDGNYMYQVVSKLKLLKKPIRKLLHDHGNLYERVNKLRLELDEIQKALDLNPVDVNLREEEAIYVQAFNDAKLDDADVLNVFVTHYEMFLGTGMDCDDINVEGLFQKKGPSRCAFKVDIQKAYDTVDWRYLGFILKCYGFHPTMIKWIMECITSTSFSISLNGDIHGFFKRKRGLRQGDPSRVTSIHGFNLLNLVYDLVSNNEWMWPQAWLLKAPKLGKITAHILDANSHDVPCLRDISVNMFEFSVKMLGRRLELMGMRLLGIDKLRQWDVGINIDLNLLYCPLCDIQPDSHAHLFIKCNFSKQNCFQKEGDLAPQ
nr:hypothetical protein [Tanacetum cinerariifolium]